MTRQGEVLHWNKGAEAVFGYSANESIGRRIDELIVPPDPRMKTLDTRGDRRRGRCHVRIGAPSEGRHFRVRRRLVEARARPGPCPARSFFHHKDVTPLRVLRDTKHVEARFREVLESTPDGIVMANPTGHIVFTNSQAREAFRLLAGRAARQAGGSAVAGAVPAAHFGHRAKYFSQPRTRSMGAGLELYGLRKDGAEFPVEISLSPLQRTRPCW